MTVLRRFGQLSYLIIRRNFTLTLEIASHDTSYPWVLHWLASKARSANGSRFQRAAGQHLSVETNVVRTDAGRIRAAFNFIPSTGVHYIFHQGRVLRVERTRSQQTLQGASTAPFESVTLTTLGRDTSIFNALLEDARSAAAMKDEGWTVIYKAFGSEWRQFGYPRPRRPLNSVVLDKGLTESISFDVKDFIESQAWYTERGIPYRRGYLLYGPPGCGKSSFITALAGHLEYSICVLNLSEVGMSADRLDHLLTHAPLQSIILLEDIDAALPSRDQSVEASKTHGRAYEGMQMLTLSGLLNALDGVASTEGRILFMTTNYVDRLDPALVRPGRVDFRAEIGLCSRDQLQRMFSRFYPTASGTVHPLAAAFAAELGEGLVSPAQVQGYLLLHKQSPEAAIRNLPEFKASQLANRRGGTDQAKTE
ncbi:mitochondrial chaperone [Sparganum proliferum]